MKYYIIVTTILAVGRALDLISTRHLTPNFDLELNQWMKKVGWRNTILINIGIILAFPLIFSKDQVVTFAVLSALMAFRNYQFMPMVKALGDKKGILMGNHGLLVVGRSIPEAFHLIYYLEQACRMQIDLVSSGEELVELPHDVQNQARDYFINNPNPTGEREWPAHLRMLDRIDPSYRT